MAQGGQGVVAIASVAAAGPGEDAGTGTVQRAGSTMVRILKPIDAIEQKR